MTYYNHKLKQVMLLDLLALYVTMIKGQLVGILINEPQSLYPLVRVGIHALS